MLAPIIDQACWDSPELRFSISLWYQVAERLGVSLGQLVVAWSIRNATSQCVILSANTVDHMVTLLNSLQVRVRVLKAFWKLWCRLFQLLPKLTNAIMDDIDKVLSNKPSRPAMVSTLQQRWAATGGMPPQWNLNQPFLVFYLWIIALLNPIYV